MGLFFGFFHMKNLLSSAFRRSAIEVVPKLYPESVNEVVVHIGMKKTGSTAIQNFLQKNSHMLAEHDLIFPGENTHKRKRNESYRNAGHGPIIQALSSGVYGALHALREEIARSDAQRVILSSENLFFASPTVIERLALALQGVKVKVVVYLRRRDQWLESVYGEDISGGNGKCTAEFKDYCAASAKQLDYLTLVNRWSEYFGKEAICIRPYEACRSKPLNVVGDFLGVLGLDLDVLQYHHVTDDYANLSPLWKSELMLMREMNKLPYKDVQSYKEFSDAFVGAFSGIGVGVARRWFSVGDREKLLNFYKVDDKRLSDCYFNGGELFPKLTEEELLQDIASSDAEHIEISIGHIAQAFHLYLENQSDLQHAEYIGGRTAFFVLLNTIFQRIKGLLRK